MSNNRNGFEVAVIGMAGRFPGAGDMRQFWQNLRNGVESIAFLSDQEVLAANADPAWLKMPNYVKAGGILEGIEYFDAAFFGYSPREAEVMDPQHRLFLECAWEALEDSGYSSDVGENVIGVFAGVGMSGYLINIYSNPDVNEATDVFQVVFGNDKDYVTTRVCYKLNLRGPGVTVQTACSTSLVATHLGFQSLLSGACDIALVGGVTISAAQKIGYFYQVGGILSPDGHTRAFDAGAQGCVGGNGLGIVVLKRLEDALADGDSIRAVIKGSAINNDGSLKAGYTAPSVDGQGSVIRAALAMAGVRPETVTYVETHGTGTPLGDPVEIAGLNLAYGAKGRKRSSCALGAVKTNIGHLDTAAGVAGLIKTILALEHKQIPPSLNFQLPNPRINFDGGPFYVNTALTEWETFGHPRRAGVSSFGIGGTNAHIIIEEAPAPKPVCGSRPWQLLLLSAKTESALDEMTSRLAERFEQQPSLSLADAAYTLQVGRRTFPHRRAVLCENLDDAVAALRARQPQRVKTGMKLPQNPSVVFMFPGQGAQYVGMGFELYQTEPTFRQQVDSCCDLLKPDIGFDLRSVLYPGERTAESGQQLRQTLVTQTALFVIEYALAKLWIEWGVRPQAMIGHSLGEYVAACLAGVFSLEEALRLVATRGRLMAESPAGGMLAVPLPEQEVASLVISKPLSLAAVNTPSQCVIAGACPVVEEFARQLDERAISYKPLEVSHAFHSEMMEPVLKPFLDQIGSVNFKAPEIPYISNVTGAWITEAEATDPHYWANHLRQTVRFSDGLKVLLKEQKYVMLELGPGQSLSKLVKQHLDKSSGQIALASLPDPRRSESEMQSMLSALGRLWISGVGVDWPAFYARQRRRRVPLPTYPFERKRYWVERRVLTREPDTPQPSLREKPDPAGLFHVPVWRQSTPPLLFEVGQKAQDGSRWLLFLDACGLGQEIAERLESQGAEVVTVQPGTQFMQSDDRRYVIDPRRSGDYESLIKRLRASGHAPTRIVHLWAVTSTPGAAARTGESFEWPQHMGFDTLLLLARALAEHGPGSRLESQDIGEPVRITVISNHIQKVIGAEVLLPEKATLLGPVRVIPREYPNVICRSIDLDLDAPGGKRPSELAEHLLAELKTDSSEQVIAYRGNTRWVQTFETVRMSCPEGRPRRLRDRGVYLITGGLEGLGFEIARGLARTAHARLVLIEGSELPPSHAREQWLETHDDGEEVSRKVEKLCELERLAAEVFVGRAELADRDQVQGIVAEALRRFGVINGVIHAAGVAPEGHGGLKTRGMAAQTLASKVQEARLLAEMFETSDLDLFFLCSSLNSLVGGIGSVDDCAASAFFNAFVHAGPIKRAAAAMAINWDGLPAGHRASGPSASPGATSTDIEPSMTDAESETALKSILWASLPQLIVSPRDPQAVFDRQWGPVVMHADAEADPGRLSTSAYLRPDLDTAYVAPRNDNEAALAEIWRQQLGIERVGVNDNFFELGGDSVISIQIVAKASQAGLRLSPKNLFEYPTIAELAQVASPAQAIKAEQGLVSGSLPLTPIQCWFFESDLADAHHFNQAILLAARQRIEIIPLERAVAELLLHHDALRLRFVRDESGWRQFIASGEPPVEIIRVDLTSVPGEEQAGAIEAAAAQLQTSLDFCGGPLMRVALFELAGNEPQRLLIVIHHLAVDGLSWRILLEDLQKAYRAAGRPIQLPPKTTSFKSWAERLKEYAESDALDQEVKFWLDDARKQVKPLPVDFPGCDNTSASGQAVSVSLNAEETRALLLDVPPAYNTQINDSLLAALALTVRQWTGETPVLVDMEGHGREEVVEEVDLSRTVGWFTTIYPVALTVGDGRSPGEALKRVKEELRRIPNNGIGYGLLKYLSPKREIAEALRALPPAEVSFLYLGQLDQVLDGDAAFAPARESSGPSRSLNGARQYLFEVSAMVLGEELRVTWVYSENLHRQETVEKLAQGFVDNLRWIIAHCQSPAAGGYTPSDFPLAGLDEDGLRGLLDGVEFEAE